MKLVLVSYGDESRSNLSFFTYMTLDCDDLPSSFMLCRGRELTADGIGFEEEA